MKKLLLLAAFLLFSTNAYAQAFGISGMAQRQTMIYHPGYISGYWYGPNVSCSAVTIPTDSRVYAHPFPIYRSVTVDKLGSYLSTTGTGSQARFGIYDATATGGRPNRLLASTGTFSTVASAAFLSADLTSEVRLNPGVYWLAQMHTWATTAPQFCGFNASTALTPTLIGGAAGTGAISGLVSQTPFYVYVDGTYASGLPNPFGTPTAITGNVAGEMAVHIK